MDLKVIYQNVVDGQIAEVEAGVRAALDSGVDPKEILDQALIAAIEEVGRLYEAGEFFIPEMLVAAHAMKGGMKILKPYLVRAEVKSVCKVGLGTVKGDLHDIGKNLVAMMLEGSGFEVIDLGVDVAPEIFVKAAQNGVQIIGLSALLTTTMGNMQTTIEALKTAGLRDKVKVIIGGAPLSQEYANQIGADGFAADASSASRLVRQLIT
ncbi:MAG: methyltransferase [Chloroflexi bacterium RBG_19FT_COMBO_50_10]|nr:MAG: methyltransferase [Chloroflexi bacterium RBG_19FT_COMBO_50_10]